MNIKRILKETKYKLGYIRRVELIDGADYGGTDTEMVSYYNLNDNYIGSKREVRFLIKKRGIAPELSSPTHNVCSVGFSRKDGKWYGWSHRAIYGFKIGDRVKEGDCCSTSGFTDDYLKEHPEKDESMPVGFEATTLEDCRRMAVAFANSVS